MPISARIQADLTRLGGGALAGPAADGHDPAPRIPQVGPQMLGRDLARALHRHPDLFNCAHSLAPPCLWMLTLTHGSMPRHRRQTIGRGSATPLLGATVSPSG